jgi:hypothetical protein
VTEQANEALSELDAAAQIATMLDGPDEGQPEDEEEQAQEPIQDEGDAEEGEEITAEDAEETEPTPEELEEITWNGETKKVPKSELKELAQKGFDYTQKTQSLAAERKAFEMQVQTAQQQFQLQNASLEIITQVKAMDSQLEQFKAVDWHALAESDPVKYLQLNQSYRDLKEARNEKVGEFQQYANQLQQSQQQAMHVRLSQESQKLAEKMPELTRQESKQALKSYLAENGFSDSEIASLADHRQAVVAWKAMQFDKLQASKPALTKKVADVPKVLKPSAQKPVVKGPDKNLAVQLKKTGRMDTAAKLIESML